MKFYFRYYVLDLVSETIIGNFFASSVAMAQKIMDTFDFKKANLDPSDVKVFRTEQSFVLYETFGEVMQAIGQECNEFEFQQRVLDFDEGEELHGQFSK